MSPASPVWLRVRVLQALWPLLAVLLAPRRLWAVFDFEECTWQIVLNNFSNIGLDHVSDHYFDQEPLDTVGDVFRTLVDSPIDPGEEYLGFPYYLKINYSCKGTTSEEDKVRRGHLMGLKPLVLVTFHAPVNFHRWKIEQLQIQMEAAPFRSKGSCEAMEVCVMSWYTPMPIKNGSVVMSVEISSNGLGPFIPNERFHVNINGFLKRDADYKVKFTVGNELFELMPEYFVNAPSRPLWYTMDQSPVLILGGVLNEKAVLLTDTNFKDFSLVELSIDSCWVGSFYCPHANFSATIHDAISTESTLFIRQNQLVYYFSGTYNTLYDRRNSNENWVRVLASECIKRLCPVVFSGNGSDHILALTTGKHEGYIHFGTITDGLVSFEMLPKKRSVCQRIAVFNCSIIWAIYLSNNYKLMLLVEIQDLKGQNHFNVIQHDLVLDKTEVLYVLPQFLPNAEDVEFLMIGGQESYSSSLLIPKGMLLNTYNNLLFIWGNFLLQSFNSENFIYLANFPKNLTIKYLVSSYRGDVAIVTENEEIWYLIEGSYRVYQLFPSSAWNTEVSLQMMQKSTLYANNETMLTLFYDYGKLYQLVYLMDSKKGRIVKRSVPVEKLLISNQLSLYQLEQKGDYSTLSFGNLCPFMVIRLGEMPNPQMYTRQERYRARPPLVLESSGFHSEASLAVYQGLVYYLLWLHDKYHKPYADPVHDPTWRWWKNKKQDKDYYFYLASNRLSAGGVHIDMDSYEKIYNLKSSAQLPERIFLDKGTEYHFSIFLTARGISFKMSMTLGSSFQVFSKVSVSVVLADPECVDALVTQRVLVNRNSVLFQVTIKEKSFCYKQGISGKQLKKTALMAKVVGSSGHCFQNTLLGPRMQGNLMVPVFIGCPPGKRLAFDITNTLQYNHQQNKHYFDCVKVDPEMPCFLFRDLFYPFFLIQDLVTGESGSFKGSYILKVVGGGPTMESIRDYSQEEIYRYNSPLDKTHSRIWTIRSANIQMEGPFYVMSHQSLGNSGIEWLCLENSPCYDTVPQDIFTPEFFFRVLVTNSNVDNSTYCNHQLTFLLHIHGLPLSSRRALFIVMVSSSLFGGLVVLYIIFCLLWPYMVKACTMLRWKINNIIASESSYTYASSSRAFSISSQASLRPPSKASSKVDAKVEEDKAK